MTKNLYRQVIEKDQLYIFIYWYFFVCFWASEERSWIINRCTELEGKMLFIVKDWNVNCKHNFVLLHTYSEFLRNKKFIASRTAWVNGFRGFNNNHEKSSVWYIGCDISYKVSCRTCWIVSLKAAILRTEKVL